MYLLKYGDEVRRVVELDYTFDAREKMIRMEEYEAGIQEKKNKI